MGTLVLEQNMNWIKKEEKKEHELSHEVISILDLITNHERNRQELVT